MSTPCLIFRTLISIISLALLPYRAGAQQPQHEDPPAESDTLEAAMTPSGPDWRGPIANRNQFPLSLLFVAIVPERSPSLPRSAMRFAVNLDYSNIITSQEIEGGESLTLDLEYLRTNLKLERGLGSGFQLGVSLPLYSYTGGFLDPFVDGFHNALGLPNFLRGQTEHGLVQFRYSDDGATVLERSSSFGGVGDIAFHVKKTLAHQGPFAAALRGAVELPTGSVDKLTGNGGVDGAVGFALERVGPRFGMYGAVHVSFLGKADPFESQNVASFMIGGDWQFKPNVAASAQIEIQTSPLKSRLDVLDQSGRQIAFGLRWRSSEKFLLEWRFTEDLSDQSPDFTVGFQIRYRLGATAPPKDGSGTE